MMALERDQPVRVDCVNPPVLRPGVTIIAGQTGRGKTWLAETLFAQQDLPVTRYTRATHPDLHRQDDLPSGLLLSLTVSGTPQAVLLDEVGTRFATRHSQQWLGQLHDLARTAGHTVVLVMHMSPNVAEVRLRTLDCDPDVYVPEPDVINGQVHRTYWHIAGDWNRKHKHDPVRPPTTAEQEQYLK